MRSKNQSSTRVVQTTIEIPSDWVDMKIDIRTGIMSVNYDAYSCDSSFSEEIPGIKFDPFTGKPLSSMAVDILKIEKDIKEDKRKEEESRYYTALLFKKNQGKRRVLFTESLERFVLDNPLVTWKKTLDTNEVIYSVLNEEFCNILEGQGTFSLILHLRNVISKEKQRRVLQKLQDSTPKVKNNKVNEKTSVIKVNSYSTADQISILRYRDNKVLSVGSNCECPSCGTKFVKKHYQQVFCKSKGGTACKDYFHNHYKYIKAK